MSVVVCGKQVTKPSNPLSQGEGLPSPFPLPTALARTVSSDWISVGAPCWRPTALPGAIQKSYSYEELPLLDPRAGWSRFLCHKNRFLCQKNRLPCLWWWVLKSSKSRKIKTFGNHLKPLETFGNHWKPFGNLRKASETLGNLRKPSKTFKKGLKKQSFGTKWVKFWSPEL